MSTETSIRPHGPVRRAGVALVATWAVTWARAADVRFRPTMSFGLFHDGNISVTGEGRGDDVAALAFDLAVDRNTPTSTLSFSYRPTYVAYQESTDLNYFGNTVALGFATEASRESKVIVDARASRTDYQGLTPDTADQAQTFVPRTTLTQASAKVAGTYRAGRRGFVDWQLRGGADWYEEVSDVPFNDSTAFGAGIAWRSELTARNTLGVGLDVGYYGYETSSSVRVGSIGLVGTSSIDRFWTVDYSVGASRATSEDDSIFGFSFNAKIKYEVEQDSTFSAGAGQGFAPGTGVGGATQDRGAWIAFEHAPAAKGLSGSVLGGYWQRDELEFASSTTTGSTASVSVNGGVGWCFNQYVTLSAAYVYNDQKARDGAPSSDTHYNSYGLYLRWALRGR